MIKLKLNLLKVLAFFTRATIIVDGFLLIILAAIALITDKDQSKRSGYVLTLITGIILVFPFRLLKSAGKVKIYFNILSITTVSLLATTWLTYGWKYAKSDIIYTLIYILNICFVYLYLRHRKNSKYINPLIEKRGIKRLLKISAVVLLVLLTLGSYLFIDIRNTPRGKKYITIPFSIPNSEALFTKAALDSDYKLTSGSYEQNKALTVSITRQNIVGDDFIELYENNKKIFRVDYNSQHIIKTSTFDKNGREFITKGYEIYGRKFDGQLVEVPESQIYSALNNLDLEVYHFVTTNSFYNKPGNPRDIYELTVKIDKTIDYPQRQIPLLPFQRGKRDWNISLKDSKGTIPLITSILLWY